MQLTHGERAVLNRWALSVDLKSGSEVMFLVVNSRAVGGSMQTGPGY